MDTSILIREIRARGVSIAVDGDGIKVSAESEPDAETLVMVEELGARKAEAMSLLIAEAMPRRGITTADVMAIWPGARVLSAQEIAELADEKRAIH